MNQIIDNSIKRQTIFYNYIIKTVVKKKNKHIVKFLIGICQNIYTSKSKFMYKLVQDAGGKSFSN